MAERWLGRPSPDAATPPPVPVTPLPPSYLDFTAFYRRELPALVALAAAIAGTPGASSPTALGSARRRARHGWIWEAPWR